MTGTLRGGSGHGAKQGLVHVLHTSPAAPACGARHWACWHRSSAFWSPFVHLSPTFFFFPSHRKGIIPKWMIQSFMVWMNLAFGFLCSVLAHQFIWWPAAWLVNGDGPCLFFSETSLTLQQGKTLSHGHAQSSCNWMNCLISFIFWQRVGQNPKSCH